MPPHAPAHSAHVSRRDFFVRSAAFSAGFAGLASLFRHDSVLAAFSAPSTVGYGPLLPDPLGFLDLPARFSYTVISRAGEAMNDALLVPWQHDGMAAFSAPDNKVLLVRNHELDEIVTERGPFGPANARLKSADRSLLFNPGLKGAAGLGGTSTLLYDPATRRLERHAMSLMGTLQNCAGGPTPWGSWLTCEETTLGTKDGLDVDHGWVFEVPSSATTPVKPEPLRAMGRFRHEAVAINPSCGCVYLTEDLADGVFYRFLPKAPGNLRAGGRLQALVFIDSPNLVTHNWNDAKRLKRALPMPVKWIDLSDPDSPNDNLREQAASHGASAFARSEGIWWGNDAAYFAATSGGKSKLGQIWKYTPSPHEGTPAEEKAPATLELFLEPNDSTVCNNADNITVAPWGDLIVCEDGEAVNGLVGVTPAGQPYRLAQLRGTPSETAGACFSPDGRVLFFNVQTPGMTIAVAGPWR